jgi:hypothetical protein
MEVFRISSVNPGLRLTYRCYTAFAAACGFPKLRPILGDYKRERRKDFGFAVALELESVRQQILQPAAKLFLRNRSPHLCKNVISLRLKPDWSRDLIIL